MLNPVDQQFHDLYNRLLDEGHLKDDRTAVGTLMLPAQMMRFDTSEGRMPILSTRAIPTKSFRQEMHKLFIAGTSSIKGLRDEKIGIWDGWFIKGTDRYEEPIPNTYSEILMHAIEKAGAAKVTEVVTGYLNDPELSEDSEGIRVKVAEAFDIPLNNFEPKPISIQRRLSRVSKNDINAWTIINVSMDGFGEVSAADEMIKLVIFDTDIKAFGEMQFPVKFIDKLQEVLDKLDIPKYELVDADIGPGSYGIQWRHWQDTQLIDKDQVDEYLKQGYEMVTEVDSHPPGRHTGKWVVYREIDQLQEMIDKLKYKPDDRRNIVNAWNVGRTWQAALPPCHLYFQCVSWSMTKLAEFESAINGAGKGQEYFQAILAAPEDLDDMGERIEFAKKYVIENDLPTRMMSMFVLMRSSDAPLGAVFNVAQYAYLQHMLAHLTNHATSELISVGVDSHIYLNQVEKIRELLAREESPEGNDPRIVFKRKVESIDDFTIDDMEIVNYSPLDKIDIPVAI